MRKKIAYEETYKPGTMRFAQEFLPTLRHLAAGAVVIGLELRKAGTVDDGTEFQDVRITIKPAHKLTSERLAAAARKDTPDRTRPTLYRTGVANGAGIKPGPQLVAEVSMSERRNTMKVFSMEIAGGGESSNWSTTVIGKAATITDAAERGLKYAAEHETVVSPELLRVRSIVEVGDLAF